MRTFFRFKSHFAFSYGEVQVACVSVGTHRVQKRAPIPWSEECKAGNLTQVLCEFSNIEPL